MELSKGLYNLSNLQDEAEAGATIDRLEELATQWAGDGEIVSV